MNILDFIIAAIIAYCIIRGVFRGIIKEASSIIGVFAGLYAAYTYHPSLSKDLAGFKNLFPTGEYINIISFLLLFTLVFLIVGALGILIRILLKIVFLSWVDRLFGGVFGFIRGFMIASVLVFVLTTFLSGGASVIRESALTPFVASAAGAMSQFAGQSMRNQFNSNMNAAKKSWDDPDGDTAPAEVKKPAAGPKQITKPAQTSKTKKDVKTGKSSKTKPASKTGKSTKSASSAKTKRTTTQTDRRE